MGEAEFGLYGIFRYWLTIPIGVISITLAPYVIFPFTDYCLGNIANYTHSLLFCFWFNWTMNTGVAWFVQAVVEHPVSKFWYPLSAAISASCWVFLVGFKLYPIPFGCYLLCGAASLPTSFPVLYFMIPKEVRENKKKVLIGALKLVHNTIPFVIFACVYRAIFIRLEGTSWQLPFSFVLPFMKWLWIKLGVKECPDGVGFIHGQSFIITMTYCFSSLLFIHIDEPFTFAVIMLQQNLPWIIQWRFLGWKIGHVTATVDETVKTVRSSLFSGKKKVAVGSTSTPAADVPSPITADAAAAAGGEGDAMNKKPVLRSQQSRLSVAGKGMDQSHADKLYWNQRDFENRVIAHFYDRFIQGCVLFYNAVFITWARFGYNSHAFTDFTERQLSDERFQTGIYFILIDGFITMTLAFSLLWYIKARLNVSPSIIHDYTVKYWPQIITGQASFCCAIYCITIYHSGADFTLQFPWMNGNCHSF